jgi:hypothetical protein
VLLTACGSRAIRRTADGRRPVDTGTHYFGAAVLQIGATDGPSSSSNDAGTTLPRVLDVDDLTVLTGWAEAAAETLAHAPDRIPALVADARPDAAWRSELGITEPSPQLGEAIESLNEKLQAAAREGGTPTFDAVLVAAYEDRSGEQTLGELVSAINPRAAPLPPRGRTRQLTSGPPPAGSDPLRRTKRTPRYGT